MKNDPINSPGYPDVPVSTGSAEPALRQIFPDKELKQGLILFLLSGALFCLSGGNASGIFLNPLLFLFNMAPAAYYTVLLLLRGKMKWFWKAQPSPGEAHRLVAAMLWLISCFALNRSVSVFAESDPWLSVCILSLVPGLALYIFRADLPRFWSGCSYFFLALQLQLWIYFSLRLIPFYLFAIPGMTFMGIGFHALVPVWLSIALYKIVKRNFHGYKGVILPGLALPVVLAGIFIYHATVADRETNRITAQAARSEHLPQWVSAAQRLPATFANKQYLSRDLLYQTPGESFFSSNSGSLKKTHNPLVFLSALFTREPRLPGADRLQILKTWSQTPREREGIFAYLVNIPYAGKFLAPIDYRHGTERLLWSGANLTTREVKTGIEVYPEYRVAYTEKTFTIRNSAIENSRQEALYSFYLPEGSAVSSLSLWINGKEEKGFLTTRQKADSAYRAIVGVEARDPAVVHWQEGSRVTVRVFPCTNVEDRQFKIGITSPMQLVNGRLHYRNIQFGGPSPSGAPEDLSVRIHGTAGGFQTSVLDFSRKNQTYSRTGEYTPHWEFSLDAPPLVTTPFSFNGKNYSLRPYQEEYTGFIPATLYLDLNKSWTKTEFDSIIDQAPDAGLHVYDDGWQQLTPANRDELFERLSKLEFSLFPVHYIRNPETALLITKGTTVSPVLSDLKGSEFAGEMSRLAGKAAPLRTLVLGESLSPYQKTLKELRVLHIDHVLLPDLLLLLNHRQFIRNTEEHGGAMLVEEARMIITEDTTALKKSAAPDHLLRLFAYNHILQALGSRYFSGDSPAETLINEAETAYVVTPVSSLVVLESQKDYDRFDIKKSRNSLENAAMHKSGAVPEPHEWALIALLCLFILFTTYKHYV